MKKKFIREYIQGGVIIKVWEVEYYDGKSFFARTIHPLRLK